MLEYFESNLRGVRCVTLKSVCGFMSCRSAISNRCVRFSVSQSRIKGFQRGKRREGCSWSQSHFRIVGTGKLKMRNRNILISGAGIAGTSLAYWLRRYGFNPVLIEQAPKPRSGGYIIDFWGRGFDVAEKMNLLPALVRNSYEIDEIRIVDELGRKTGGFSARAIQALLGDRFLSILRSDLARAIYQSLDGTVPTMFGDTITAIEQDESRAHVSFLRSPPQTFDLVIGAGGLHSPVRKLVFGSDERYEKYLGYYVASFSIAHYPRRNPRAYVSYATPGRQVSRYTLRADRTVFFFVFAADQKLAIKPHQRAEQIAILKDIFRNDGWECHDILRALNRCDDLYFDSVSQIRMPSWVEGRVALIGDSCFCPSLLAGQGASLAMSAAYVLAGELKKARGDYRAAFTVYEKMLQPVMVGKQRAAQHFAGPFAPKTRFGILARNYVTRFMMHASVTKLFMGRLLSDPFELPVYE
jgi:2-polyprenyl-6-methoxyphenol hydroxylase-like FAD-dependent oxidoreductase